MTQNRIRNKGSYAPLSAHYYKDDAIDAAGPWAELLFVRGLAFCADVLSDGYISHRQLLRFVGVGLPNVEESALALVDTGLWERDIEADGYWVRSWLGWNRSRDEITDHQAKDAARKRQPELNEAPEGTPPTPPKGRAKDSTRTPHGLHTDSTEPPGGSPNGIRPRARTPLLSNSTTALVKNTPPPASQAERDPEGFSVFWAAYPRKVDKRTALKAYRAALKRGAPPGKIIEAARSYAQEKLGTEPKYVKHASTWLNADAFDNDPEPLRLVTGGNSASREPFSSGDREDLSRYSAGF